MRLLSAQGMPCSGTILAVIWRVSALDCQFSCTPVCKATASRAGPWVLALQALLPHSLSRARHWTAQKSASHRSNHSRAVQGQMPVRCDQNGDKGFWKANPGRTPLPYQATDPQTCGEFATSKSPRNPRGESRRTVRRRALRGSLSVHR
ncbi:hypothetical protein PYCCODRAFT_875001 [Trametes coccinea BRFM310]|uniref:Secreted protein n=1 Tax=Trametes coccinea (strain BRFM310) TaxID=1353009 RepID=A0A1Y2IFY0_TRAC3|nr:hypothetical protein PYCCODRAFT_875001 [Trametes coccinea BRFM310]